MCFLNKLMGFFELKELNIPTVPWQKYTPETMLDESMLWTLRVAVNSGNDLNLPRLVGVTAAEAREKGNILLEKYKDIGLVIYYPYFIADKSGVIDISSSQTVIEAVDKDLWNLVTYGHKNVTVFIKGQSPEYIGNRAFMGQDELDALLRFSGIIRSSYREIISTGKSIIAEWSFAYNTDVDHKPLGEKYLVFYELRSI